MGASCEHHRCHQVDSFCAVEPVLSDQRAPSPEPNRMSDRGGDDLVRLTEADLRHDWPAYTGACSPDGDRILFGPSGASDWSPDGRQVAFVGSDGDFWKSDRHAVFTVAVDGSDLKRITQWGDVLSFSGRQMERRSPPPWRVRVHTRYSPSARTAWTS